MWTIFGIAIGAILVILGWYGWKSYLDNHTEHR